MISFKALTSATSAASYFAADNYYTVDQTEQLSAWVGAGAEALGLTGPVDEQLFAAALEGRLPTGVQIAASQGKHRPGVDITMQASKSASLLALLGQDERIVEAMRQSVTATLGWAEKNVMEARVWDPALGGQVPEKTGNLVAATFLHDINRNAEPHLHVHAVVASATVASDGKWHAMNNHAFYEAQHVLSAVHNSEFRARIEALGYETVPSRNPVDGAFEIKGVGRDVVEAFSTRRAEILEALARDGRGSAEERQIATFNTRRDKDPELDPVKRDDEWHATARSVGFDPAPLIEQARLRAGKEQTMWARIVEGVRGIGARGIALAAAMGITPRDGDSLVPERLGRLDPASYAAAQAVASAARELGENEAAFTRHDLIRTALERQGPFTVAAIEARINLLIRGGQLIGDERMLTTEQAVRMENRVIDLAKAGKGVAGPIASGVEVGVRLQASARELGLHRLNPGQEQAGVDILTSADRVHLVQGGAGVGKSAALAPVAAIARAEGRKVVALAHVGRTAREFGAKTGAPASTVDGFLRKHARILDGTASPATVHVAQGELAGALVMVDEASQVGTDRVAKLIDLANRLDVGRLVFAGDKDQLPAIERGRPFADLQQEEVARSVITENLRAKSPQMQAINEALGRRDVRSAFAVLRPNTQDVPVGKVAETAAKVWAALPKEQRETTLLLAAGRSMRDAGNRAAQASLLARGEIGKSRINLTVLDRINATREGARQMKGYIDGRVVEFAANLRKQGFSRGDIGEILGARDGKVELAMPDGEIRTFEPGRLPYNLTADAVVIYQPKHIGVHEGDRIRWTAKDPVRGLLNGDIAHVQRIDSSGVTVMGSDGKQHKLGLNDPMLSRLDLAYAINVHIAQGMTATDGIMMMSQSERVLNTASAFLVAATRIAEKLSVIFDNPDKIERQIEQQRGEKTAAREVAKAPPKAKDREAPEKSRSRDDDWDMGM